MGQIAAQYDFTEGAGELLRACPLRAYLRRLFWEGTTLFESTSLGAPKSTVSWPFYDRLGNVQGKSDLGGDLLETMHQDAYGNVLSNVNTGQWASTFSGRHLTTKQYDPDSELYYFWQRWYNCETGRFSSISPFPQSIEHPYLISNNRVVQFVDPSGRLYYLFPPPDDVSIWPPHRMPIPQYPWERWFHRWWWEMWQRWKNRKKTPDIPPGAKGTGTKCKNVDCSKEGNYPLSQCEGCCSEKAFRSAYERDACITRCRNSWLNPNPE